MPNDRDHSANVIIIGPRASGKSTIGRALASKLRRPFTDLDLETMRAFGECANVSQVWRERGESEWRREELEALTGIMRNRGQVIALGGGTPMIPDAFELMSRARDAGEALVIYLQCTPTALQERLRLDGGDRPALRGTSAVDEVESILVEREPTYQRLASVMIEADPDAQVVMEKIVSWLQARTTASR